MNDRLKMAKERSQKRKRLIMQTCGLDTIEDLKSVLGGNTDAAGFKGKPVDAEEYVPDDESEEAAKRKNAGDQQQPINSVEWTSSTFLKGTQSSNPHNDYCQHFVDTGQRPQNFIRDIGLADRFVEYPKLRELIQLKDNLIKESATPPMYLQANLKQLTSSMFGGTKFDVILIEPPLEEYYARSGGLNERKFWSWDEILALDIGELAAHRSFVFLWCGSSEGLDMGRNCLRKWGFRRCEDICWIRTNIENPGHSKILEPKSVFQRTKDHCLVGIKGTVRRSTDGDFIHANVDIDLIISEEQEFGSLEKPIEIFHIIEHFCLGRRRLHLFGRDSSIRPGWVTVGPELTNTNFNPDLYPTFFTESTTTGCTERIEALRPKSPTNNGKGSTRGGRGRGGGGGGGGHMTRKMHFSSGGGGGGSGFQ